MDTREFRTRTIFRETDNRKASKAWVVGLDTGYSGIKTFSGNTISCFPSYAVENQSQMQVSFGENIDNHTILYRGEDGIVWNVGADAQDAISPSDTSAGSLSIFGRSRYFSPMFKVLLRVGIASGIRQNHFGGPGELPLYIQAGLPPKYIKSDEADLRTVMKGKHDFYVKFGAGQWEHFDFTLTDDNIGIIDQPEGTLFSISTGKDMKLLPEARRYFSSKILINDPGFGTFDTFPMIKRNIDRDECQTFTDLGMKQVLKDTVAEIFEKYNFDVSVPAIQRYLESGTVLKKEGRSYVKVPFADILEKHSRDICDKAMEKVIEIYDPAVNFDYMVTTGGTGAAWSGYIRNNDIFAGDTVKLVPGNAGDPDLPYIFSNVRGYYIFAFSKFV